MACTKSLIAIVLLTGAAAFVIRRYGPAKYYLTFALSGHSRGVPLRVVAFWLLIVIACALVLACAFHKNQSG